MKNYWTRLLKIIRQEWTRNNPDRKQCFKNALTKNSDCKTILNKWMCNHCESFFALSEVQCDHVIPVSNTVPENEYEFIESFKRLHSNNLQILCKNCHKIKTKQDKYDVEYYEVAIRVSNHLELHLNFMHAIPWAILKQFDFTIQKILFFQDKKIKEKYEKKLDKLKEKYL